jgi:hypothetical protein
MERRKASALRKVRAAFAKADNTVCASRRSVPLTLSRGAARLGLAPFAQKETPPKLGRETAPREGERMPEANAVIPEREPAARLRATASEPGIQMRVRRSPLDSGSGRSLRPDGALRRSGWPSRNDGDI